MKTRVMGESVIWRSRPQGLIGYVIPFVVLEDSSRAIALFQQPGSICKRRSGPRGGPGGRMLEVDKWDGSHIDVEWKAKLGITRLHVPNSMFSVLREWDPKANLHRGWYVNLEASWIRTKLGFDSEDLILDITLADDLSSWSWKDEAELGHAVSVGRVTREAAAQVRLEGERVVAMIKNRDFPFVDDVWRAWQPDPTWKLVAVPPGWDEMEEAEEP